MGKTLKQWEIAADWEVNSIFDEEPMEIVDAATIYRTFHQKPLMVLGPDNTYHVKVEAPLTDCLFLFDPFQETPR